MNDKHEKNELASQIWQLFQSFDNPVQFVKVSLSIVNVVSPFIMLVVIWALATDYGSPQYWFRTSIVTALVVVGWLSTWGMLKAANTQTNDEQTEELKDYLEKMTGGGDAPLLAETIVQAEDFLVVTNYQDKILLASQTMVDFAHTSMHRFKGSDLNSWMPDPAAHRKNMERFKASSDQVVRTNVVHGEVEIDLVIKKFTSGGTKYLRASGRRKDMVTH